MSRFDPVNGAGAIAYSGDGLALVFPETQSTVSIYPLNALGLNGMARAFAWSPDARRIAFLYTVSGPPRECLGGYLMLADLSSGEVYPLVEAPGFYSQPAWSPDGEQLAFTEASGTLNIIRLQDGAWSTLRRDAAGAVTPSWIDVEHVAYIRHSESGPEGNAELVSQPLDGSEPHVLLADAPMGEGRFALSPDRTQLAYLQTALYLVDLRTAVKRSLGVEPALERLQWSPNGRYLIARGGLSGVFLIQPESTDPIRQLDFFGVPGIQAWAPDSQRFAVILSEDGSQRTTIDVYSLEQHTLSKLPIEVEIPFELAWSTR